MKKEIKDYIGVFTDVYPEDFCEHLIAEFNHNQEIGVGSNRQQNEHAVKHEKQDHQIFYNGRNVNFSGFKGKKTIDIFFDGLQKCFNAYSDEFSILKHIKTNCNAIKFQKTESGGGYHVWHCEQGNEDQANRSLVYMLYLNTLPVESNGETEFLYQQRRINPVKNTMVLWPASYTHAHRGNPVYGDNIKYIATGWFYNE
tara:strand:- start:1269 stop:1865 length:597 start_codon:yes stop_codon:yes gene_type:complete